ncbi:hypothetical protein [Cesiribacter andamanensis]|uniref:Uncharacterized protein n=1 Tax=Cesiribacter andamanensis AMV16 TaxID=1279009 RepID=M7NNQ2_9BACT|nr:hypothetical protein [Cesiribacter andamanensis]EMR03340.1 hypothetical protein ADICEAN_01517 [Cesiribacter andamanensis AMV16]
MKHQDKDSHDKKGNKGGMAMRGVSRPMAEKQIREHQQEMHSREDEHPEGAHKDKQGGGMKMDPEMRQNMLHMHHMQTLWIYWAIIMLGCGCCFRH